MAKNYFKRYIWLIETINRNGHITFSQLSNYWEGCGLNDKIGSERKLSPKTFFNHINAIKDMFGLQIKCNRSNGEYYIEDNPEGGEIRKWLLESLSMNNLLNESRDMHDRILFEKIPSSQKWLPAIVNAMRDGRVIEMTYQSFWRDEPNTYKAKPYCLKLFRQRWYMLAMSEGKKEPRVYALDERMIDIVVTDKKYKLPVNFDATKFFADYFGVIVGTENKPTKIKILVDKLQEKFFDSLPLHETQHKVEAESDEDYTVYQYHLAPTFDFKQEILSRGPAVTVLEPESFRQEVLDDIRDMLANY